MFIASVNMLKNEKSMSKTQSRNSMAKSHELPDIDKLEENRDYKSTNRQEHSDLSIDSETKILCIFPFFCKIILFALMCDLVHDMKTVFHIC